jgi:predicted ferric reductase
MFGSIAMKKYIKIYLKRNVIIALIYATLAFIPLFVVSLLYDYVPEDTIISFSPFLLAVSGVAVTSISIIRFKKIIRKQEKRYGIQFQDTNAEHIEKTLYISRDWLIRAGTFAFYKKHIKSITYALQNGKGGPSYKVTVKTIEDKDYTFFSKNESNIKKIRKWKNA